MVRVVPQVALDVQPGGVLEAHVGQLLVANANLGADVSAHVLNLRKGLPLDQLSSKRRLSSSPLRTLIERLAASGLLEYSLADAQGDDLIVVEPQTASYRPRLATTADDAVLVLSRFAYLRRRGSAMILESPRAQAAFRLCKPEVAATITALATPQSATAMRKVIGSAPGELLALFLDSRIVVAIDAARGSGRRAEGDDDLAMWDFHDLLFHARSTEGRHANPLGGVYPFADTIPPLPAIRPAWPGKRVELSAQSDVPSGAASAFAKVLHERHSVREFDDRHPITLGELATFLESAARVRGTWSDPLDDAGPVVEYSSRPYPSGGSAYGLELYLAVDRCEGLPRGLYHYDAGGHALVALPVESDRLDAMLSSAAFATGADTPPQVLVTVAARFGRTAWKYSSLAYSLILKDAGVLLQTLYLVATDLGLGGCAVGSSDIETFAGVTGLAIHVEGPVAQFGLGRPAAIESGALVANQSLR